MLVIPIELSAETAARIKRGPIIVVLVMEKENMDRMRLSDPFDIHFSVMAGRLSVDRPIRELDFVIAYEEDTKALLKFQQDNDLAGLLAWLERGREIKQGDLVPPVPVRLT